MSDAISAHGTIIARQIDGTGLFVEIGELGDITPPSLGRNNEDVSTHNDDIDAYVQGILRRGELTFPINLLFDNPSHDHLTGLYKSLIEHQKDGWQITFPDGMIWIFSGGISNIAPRAPVDGAQRADVTVRPSGLMKFGDVIVGDIFVT
jgi:hypothetical protein